MSDDKQGQNPEEAHESWMKSGKWAGMTIGELVSTIIDGGDSDYAFVRVTKQSESDTRGEFSLHLEIHLIPNGYVMEHAADIGCTLFHTRLIYGLQKGLVK